MPSGFPEYPPSEALSYRDPSHAHFPIRLTKTLTGILLRLVLLGQSPQQRNLPKPVANRSGWNAAPARAGRNVIVDGADGGNLGAVANRDMAVDTRLAADRDKIAELDRPGYADLRNQQTMPPNRDVVSNLDLIIDLGAFADNRIAIGAAVDRGIGADLDVVLDNDAADLGNFQVALATHREAETILANHDAGMDDHAIADQRVQDHRIGGNRTIAANGNGRSDYGISAYDCCFADFRALADDRARLDFDTGLQPSGRMDRGSRCDAIVRAVIGTGKAQRLWEKVGQKPRIGPVRFGRLQRGGIAGNLSDMTSRTQAGRGLRRCQLFDVSGIVQKGDIARSGCIQRRKAGYQWRRTITASTGIRKLNRDRKPMCIDQPGRWR